MQQQQQGGAPADANAPANGAAQGNPPAPAAAAAAVTVSAPSGGGSRRTGSAPGTPRSRQPTGTPSIYTATYSSIPVWEMRVGAVDVMRRCRDNWLNATQLLKVAQIDKPQRTKILEREIQTGVHEKVQGGYGKYQGTWVPFERGQEIAHQYDVQDLVNPLLNF
ncbi:transcription regulator HTH, apses-type DNA-binding domain-containing protein, partial [Catenaria anguillulae PL171]